MFVRPEKEDIAVISYIDIYGKVEHDAAPIRKDELIFNLNAHLW